MLIPEASLTAGSHAPAHVLPPPGRPPLSLISLPRIARSNLAQLWDLAAAPASELDVPVRSLADYDALFAPDPVNASVAREAV